MEPRIFVTSDTHFGHDRDFLYGPRGFSSVKESDEEIIRRWNSIVRPDDIVYLLGDVMLNDNDNGINCLSRLNGKIKLVFGNHDTDKRLMLFDSLTEKYTYDDGRTALEWDRNKIQLMGWATVLKYKKWRFCLSHHPTLTANYDDGEKTPRQHLINLFGHTHQKEKFYEGNPYMYHVGLDSHNCYPVLLDDVIKDIVNEVNKKGAF